MHIRKLDLHGFKSFPDRTTFHFGPGVSGVVGPNGCGKSNVVDAVKWCLGEQSARSLRGQAMQDVIFGGSEDRSPMSLAEVTLTLSAGDEPFSGDWARFDELQITRRLYRDGGSEYLINQQKARLKDIQDLFLDSGAGNRMYSFIEQGRIGQIVSAKPEERRPLIEEAAGISRYKQKREEAEQRLVSTEANLERVATSVADLATRMRSLERQVARAMRHRRLRSYIRQGEIFQGLSRFAGLSLDRRSLVDQVRQAEAKEVGLIRELEQHEAGLTKERSAAEQLEAVVGRLRDRLAEVEASRREQESARQYQSREQTELERRVEALDRQRVEAAGLREEAEKRRAEAERDRSRTEAEATTAEATLSVVRGQAFAAENTVRERRGRIEEGKTVVLNRVREGVRARTEHDGGLQRQVDLDQRLARVHLRKREAGSGVSEVGRQIEALSATVAQAERIFEERKLAAEVAHQAIAQRESEAKQSVVTLRALEAALVESEREETRLRARLESLESLQQGHAELGSGTRGLLQIPGVRGTLAEHLDVPEALEARLASLLGASLQDLVVEDDEVALAVVRAAGDARVGVISIEGRAVPTTGLAARISGSEPGLRALGALVGELDLAEDPEAALREWRRCGRGQVVLGGAQPLSLSATGELLSGDLRNEGRAVLARRREINRLKEQHAPALEQVTEARSRVEAARLARDAAQTLGQQARGLSEDARRATSEAELSVREARRHRQDLDRERLRHEALSQQIIAEETEIAGSIAALRSRIDLLKRQIAENHEGQAVAEESLQQDQQGLIEESRELGRLRDLVNQRGTEAAALRERLRGWMRAEADAKASVEGATRQLEASLQELAASRARIAELIADDERLDGALGALGAEQGSLRVSIDEEREKAKVAREAYKKLEDGLKGLRGRREEATNRRMDLDRKVTAVKEELGRIKEQLEERYSIAAPGMLDRIDRVGFIVLEPDPGVRVEGLPEAAVATAKDLELIDDMRVTAATLEDEALVNAVHARLAEARTELGKLGEVNHVALQEYTALAEEHRVLDGQRADLDQSVSSIKQTVARLDRISRERFRETFDRVNACFQETYPRLVGGGKARLHLTDEGDILNSGVEIFVQPPGKRLTTLSLLSGGETAMVAIALIFSLFRIKPSPFCLLDEVDAPLDEGNGARFNSMLREMAAMSQFIVITHNKKTMEGADTLYGVTMPSPGVSRLVSAHID